VLGIAAAAFCFEKTKTIAKSPALAQHPNKKHPLPNDSGCF